MESGSDGINDFRERDLRHTSASWHLHNGTSLLALQELGGWQGAEILRRHAHLPAGCSFAARLMAGCQWWLTRWHERTSGVGHVAAIPDPNVSFTQQTGRPLTCDGRP